MFGQMIAKVDILKKLNLLKDEKYREIYYYCRFDTYNYN